jgi:inner membrane protein
MDSLTQIVLGAAVGEVVLGRRIGNRAQLVGAIAGTLPDLDILATMYLKDDLSELVIHRSYSHALFSHFMLAFPFAWLCWWLGRPSNREAGTLIDEGSITRPRVEYKYWYLLWFLCLSTHAILDSFTTYGTQLLLPFTNHLIGFNNISVIDPLYTLPFMAILIYCLCLKRDNPKRIRWAWRSIYISSAYMLLTFVVKGYVHNTFTGSLREQGLSYNHLSTSPTFFNNALWAGMAYDDSTLIVGEFSILQKDKSIDYVQYKRNLHLEKDFQGKELETLKWFSQGLYFLELKDSQTLDFYIVKWGRSDFTKEKPKEAFIFYYEIRKEDGKCRMSAIRPSFKKGDFAKFFGLLWDRIWSK